MTIYHAKRQVVVDLLAKPRDAVTFVPSPPDPQHRQPVFSSASGQPSLDALLQPRPPQSARACFQPPSESLGCYGGGEGPPQAQPPPTVLVGLRACDLKALELLDRVLLGEPYQDEGYRSRRESATLISCDCVDCSDACFCTSLDGRPFPQSAFDVNLTPLNGGFLIEPASEKGRQWLGEAALEEASPEQIRQRDSQREQMTRRVQEQNAAFPGGLTAKTPPRLPEGDDPAWQRQAGACVECGACTNICPSCYCFYLYDQILGEGGRFERVRTWDSCLLGTYHRMAGTPVLKPTPRPKLGGRLANRVLHKFVYSPEQVGLLGCVGCGRCTEACLGGLDVRQVLREVSA